MRRMLIGSFLLLALFSNTQLGAQTAPGLERLSYYVGSWSERGGMRDDPGKPLRPIAGGETCRWAAGRTAVLCEEQTSGAGGGWQGVYILSYDAASGKYHVYGTEKPSGNMHATGEVNGERWVWTVDTPPGAPPVRYSFTPAGKGKRRMVVELGNGSEWATIVDVTYSRAK